MRSMSHCLVVTVVVVVGRSKTVRADAVDVGDGREENGRVEKGRTKRPQVAAEKARGPPLLAKAKANKTKKHSRNPTVLPTTLIHTSCSHSSRHGI